jgi:hypothetical protein
VATGSTPGRGGLFPGQHAARRTLQGKAQRRSGALTLAGEEVEATAVDADDRLHRPQPQAFAAWSKAATRFGNAGVFTSE